MQLRRWVMCVLIAGLALSSGTTLCETPLPCKEEIVQPQPLPIGARFYIKSTARAGYQVYYSYMGFEQGFLKVKYELRYHLDELIESEYFLLPMNANRQALLSTKPLYGETQANTTKLLISVVDDFSAIAVQKAR